MMNFADRLTEQIEKTGNPTVMGIDPLIEYVPDSLCNKYKNSVSDPSEATALAITEFSKGLIDSIKGIIPAVKPQLAYFELLGEHGIHAFTEIVRYAHQMGLIVIADAKRGDILSTASAYAQAFLGESKMLGDRNQTIFDADAVTVNPYLGIDGVSPFIKECEAKDKGIFILVRTSNPSAIDFQDLITQDGLHVYEAVAEKVSQWGMSTIGERGYSSVGAVVGATWPVQATALRERMPHTMILVPGYGAQGGNGDSAALCFDQHGKGAIVNASRSLMCAYRKSGLSKEDYREATYQEALKMKQILTDSIDARIK